MNQEIWKRLMWKEWRENWLYLGVCIGVLMLTVLQYKPKDYDSDNFMPAIFVIILIVVLRTALQSIAIKPGQIGYKMSMPIPSIIKYLQIYFVSFIMPLIIGLALSFAVIWLKNINQQSSPSINLLSDNYLISAAILMMISCNALVVVFARIISLIPALIAGLIYLLLILNSDLFRVAVNLDYFLWLIIALAVTAVTGEIIIAYGGRNSNNYKGISFKRVAITIISIPAFLFLLILIPIIQEKIEMADTTRIDAGQIYNNSLSVTVGCNSQHFKNGREIFYKDIKHNKRVTKLFTRCSYPVAILENNVDILVVQMNKISLYADLLKWNVDTGKVSIVVKMQKRWNEYDEFYLSRMYGNYAILYTRSLITTKNMQKNDSIKYDVWVIDIANSKMKLIVPGVNIIPNFGITQNNYSELIKWEKDKLTYYYKTKKFIITLPSFNITESVLPIIKNPMNKTTNSLPGRVSE